MEMIGCIVSGHMGMPTSTRKKGIIDTLDYASAQYRELGTAIMDSYKADGDLPKFVAQKSGIILSETRECFDRLGKDLIEHHLLPALPVDTVARYKKKKSYFPLYPDQLLKPDSVYSEFKVFHPGVYSELSLFVEAMEQDQTLGETKFRVKNFGVIANMVNEKKHDDVLEWREDKDEKVAMQANIGAFVFDKSSPNDNPFVRVVIPADAVTRKVPAYRFASNGLDVPELCLFAAFATPMLMDIFYDRWFSPTDRKVFQPEPPPIVTFGRRPL